MKKQLDTVEKHRLENEEKYGDYLDSLCEDLKGHPYIGNRLLDWRYDEDDWGKLMLWIGWKTEVDELEERVDELENRIDELEGKDVSDLSDDSLDMDSV